MLVDIVNEQAVGNDVTLILGNDVADGTVLERLNSNVGVRFIGRAPGSWNPWYALRLFHTLRRLSPDVIHVHQESFIRITSFLEAPTVLTVHDTRTRLSPHASKCATIYCISEAVRLALLPQQPYSRMMVIHNGIPCSTILQKTRYGQHPFRIVQVSRLYHEIKGQDVLLHALQHVDKILGPGSVTVDFIGEGESREFLLGLAQELKVDNWCTFLGKQSRATIYENLQAYDLLVQPSRHEGFGLTVVEAMAARVPVLVSDIGGPMEIIGAGRHGYYFRAGDHLDCAAKIIDVVEQSRQDTFPDALDRTVEYVRNQFDIADTARKYLAEYKNIINETRAA